MPFVTFSHNKIPPLFAHATLRFGHWLVPQCFNVWCVCSQQISGWTDEHNIATNYSRDWIWPCTVHILSDLCSTTWHAVPPSDTLTIRLTYRAVVKHFRQTICRQRWKASDISENVVTTRSHELTWRYKMHTQRTQWCKCLLSVVVRRAEGEGKLARRQKNKSETFTHFLLQKFTPLSTGWVSQECYHFLRCRWWKLLKWQAFLLRSNLYHS